MDRPDPLTALAESSEPLICDLGCGAHKRGNIGIDVFPWEGVDFVCNLGLDPIPLPDNAVTRFMAYDFLEHVPGYVFYKEDGRWQRLYPRIFLLREIHRCLQPGGCFESFTPVHPHQEWAQDPTHTSPPWTRNSWAYYTPWGLGVARAYGIDFEFEIVTMEERGAHLFVVVRKPARPG